MDAGATGLRTANPARGARTGRWRSWITAPRLRLVTGLVLFSFAATHLLNHALGLVDFGLMQRVQDVRTGITRSAPVTIVLLFSALTHVTLGLRRFLRRRTLRMGMGEAVQLAFGLSIPFLLLPHVVGTRVAHSLYGAFDDYAYVLGALWPEGAVRQSVLVMLVWVHGCIGLHHWLKVRPWYVRAAPVLLAVAVAVPLLALGGFAASARLLELAPRPVRPLAPAAVDGLDRVLVLVVLTYVAALGSVALFRLLRGLADRLRSAIRISYLGGPTVASPRGFTVLEVSRMHGIAHPSVCGGRARCTTCQVRVLEGAEHLPPPGPLEKEVLDRMGASEATRLACQLRPRASLRVATLLANEQGTEAVRAGADTLPWGVERQVTVMFADLRGFTSLSEHKLPFDVVFLLNQFLRAMAAVIEDHRGYVDKFIGDGIMAIFGKDGDPGAGARDALAAAKGMVGVLRALNTALADQLDAPLAIAIGLNTGPAILGHVGTTTDSPFQRITAIGDTVNSASRLERVCKDLGMQMVVARSTVAAAGLDPATIGPLRTVTVGGRSQPLAVVTVADAGEMLPGGETSPQGPP